MWLLLMVAGFSIWGAIRTVQSLRALSMTEIIVGALGVMLLWLVYDIGRGDATDEIKRRAMDFARHREYRLQEADARLGSVRFPELVGGIRPSEPDAGLDRELPGPGR